MNDLVEAAKTIFLQTLKKTDLDNVFREKLRRKGDFLYVGSEVISLSDYERTLLIGLGKASLQMGLMIEQLLDDRFQQGILVSNHRSNLKVKSKVIVAGHPLPDRRSFAAGQHIIDLIKQSDANTLIIFVISGGGSSLVEQPIFDEITLEEFIQLNQILIGCGATIQEINLVRKFLSRIKGGRLGNLAKQSQCIAIFLSDVNSGDLQALASNPLLPDDATLEEFYHIIEKYKLLAHLPPLITQLLNNRKIPLLPRNWHANDCKLIKLLLLENRDALDRAAECAKSSGFMTEIDYDQVEGNYKEIGDRLIRQLIALHNRFSSQRVCLISGGEVSCKVIGDGLGGRNQEFVMYCAAELARLRIAPAAVLSCGTDGIDGNSPADGAVADASAIQLAMRLGIEPENYFMQSDTHSYFQEFGGVITTGPTGMNIRDVRILLAG